MARAVASRCEAAPRREGEEEARVTGIGSGFKVKKRIVFGAAGVILSALSLTYVFHDIDFGKLVASASHIRVLPLVGNIFLYWFGVVTIRALLIRHLIRPLGNVTMGTAYKYICIGYLANNVLPFRMGEAVRCVGLARRAEVGIASVAGALALERLLDLAMFVYIGIAATLVAPVPDISHPDTYHFRQLVLAGKYGAIAVGAGLTLAFVVLAVISRRKWAEIAPDPGRRLRVLAWNLAVRFSSGFNALSTSRGLFTTTLLAAGIWFFMLAGMILRFKAFGLPPEGPGAPLIVPMVLLVTAAVSGGVALPSLPAFLGVYHAAVVFALNQVFGIPKEEALGFAIFSHAIDISLGSLAGALGLSLEGMGLADLRRATGLKAAGDEA
ncbi:MAG: lysylphosphatidylglycerol synthase transmembrane domain-containing protein [Deltaproteobacteria bacterium]|nr:lysylphosphatidylglycerol synthase transmembrane domain-containing protein [Deltaproteobacteria bacterium]